MSPRIRFRGREAWVRIKDRILMELQHPGSETTNTIAHKAINGIIRRTRSGIDVAGIPFKPYTLAYAAKKGSTRVDLTSSGQMLAREGFKFEVMSDGRKIFIRFYMDGEPRATIASVHNFGMRSGRGAGFQMARREFFGLDQKIIEEITNYTRERWKQLFQRIG